MPTRTADAEAAPALGAASTAAAASRLADLRALPRQAIDGRQTVRRTEWPGIRRVGHGGERASGITGVPDDRGDPAVSGDGYGAPGAPGRVRFDRQDGLIWTRSGEQAIALALAVLGIGPGHRVLVPTCHCPSMIAPVVRAGAEPVFYPLSTHGAPDIAALARLIGCRPRAMLVAHLFGITIALDELLRRCADQGCVLIEDCAHAFFHAPRAPLAVASLTKFFAVPDGGILRIADPDLFARASAVMTHEPGAARHELRASLHSLQAAAFARLPPDETMRARLPHGLAALMHLARAWTIGAGAAPGPGASRITRWLTAHSDDERIATIRRRNFERYRVHFRARPGFTPLLPALPPAAVPYVFALRVAHGRRVHERLRRMGAPVWRWDQRWPGTPRLRGDTGACWASTVLQLACHQDLTPDAIDAIAEAVLADEPACTTQDGTRNTIDKA